MALPILSLELAVAASPDGLSLYFYKYVRYSPDSRWAYAIRIGSKTLFSDDTMDLRKQLTRYIATEKARRTRLKRRKIRKTARP